MMKSFVKSNPRSASLGSDCLKKARVLVGDIMDGIKLADHFEW